MTSLNPVHTIGRQLVEAVLLHRDVSKKQARARARRAAEGRRHPARRAPHRRLPAPVLGRHAPARDDRDGADQRPRPADRRRADDGARRDDAGADPRPDADAAAGVRQRDHHDHARPRRRRRDRRRRRRHVRGQGRRAGPVDEIFNAAAPPVHLGPARLAAAARRRRRAADADPGPAAVAAQPAARLPLPPALPVRDGHLPPKCPELAAGRRRSRTTSQRCHLDEETKDREAAKLLAATMAEAETADGAAAGDATGDELLVVEDLEKHFPVTRGIIFQKQVASVKAVDGVTLHRQAGRDARRRRRVRLRQVDDGALHHAPARPDRRQDHLRRAATSRSSRARRCARSGAR